MNLTDLAMYVNADNAVATWKVVFGVVALLLGILLPILFLTPENKKRFKRGFGGWLYNVLSFEKTCLDKLIPFTYITTTIFLTLNSFFYIKMPFVFFKKLFVAIVITRLVAELAHKINNIDKVEKK